MKQTVLVTGGAAGRALFVWVLLMLAMPAVHYNSRRPPRLLLLKSLQLVAAPRPSNLTSQPCRGL